MYIEMGVRYTILTSSKNSKILKENKNNLLPGINTNSIQKTPQVNNILKPVTQKFINIEIKIKIFNGRWH